MKYVSTRGPTTAPLSFSQALAAGLAPDGGLYVPQSFPHVNAADFVGLTMAQTGARLLPHFVTDDPRAADLPAICAAAFNFPIPLKYLKNQTAVLELFHGPTAAFKDVGARFLAECILWEPPSEAKPRTVIVATSGDTGGAVAGAFFNRPGIDVFVLFPKGKISRRQELQISAWGGNVRALAVNGSFDDCQRVVKEALADSAWRDERTFISANSISIGRLLPQMVYYAKSSVEYHAAKGVAPGYIVPTGNLGNAMAALWAKRAGFPIGAIVLATNANRAIAQFFASGQWQPGLTIATLANAMDVGNPSNMERLRSLYPDTSTLFRDVTVVAVDDVHIEQTIREGETNWGETWCPHTATAVRARELLGGEHWVVVATAHPAKFETIVEPLVGHAVPVPPALAELLHKTPHSVDIEASLADLKSKFARP